MVVTQQFGDATGYNCAALKHTACCYSIVATLRSAIQFIRPDAAAPELQVAAGWAPGLQASLWEQALTP